MSFLKDKIELSIQEAEFAAQQNLNSVSPFFKWLLILGILAVLPSYFIAKNISYNIWKNTYSQDLISPKPSFTNPKEPKVTPVSVTTMGQGIYAAVVKISNTNLDLSANNIPYTFNFINSKKETVYTESGKFFLLPDQTKYISVPRFSTQEDIAFTEFLITKEQLIWQKKLNIPTVKIITSQPNSYEQFTPLAFVVEGDFTNQSPYTVKQIRLNFILFDQKGTIIGTSQRDEFTVAPFERRTYKQLWPGTSNINIANVKIFTDTNTLDPNNLSIESFQDNSSSNLNRPKTQNPF